MITADQYAKAAITQKMRLQATHGKPSALAQQAAWEKAHPGKKASGTTAGKSSTPGLSARATTGPQALSATTAGATIGGVDTGSVLAAAHQMDPGGRPDYFGNVGNYANSPLPYVDGTGNVVPGTGIRKFVEALPGVGAANQNDLGQYIPQAVPDTTTFKGSDYYVIALVEYSRQLHPDLPPTTLRGYVQIDTGNVPGSHKVPLARPDGSAVQWHGKDLYTVDPVQYMGPMIVARRNTPVRVTFLNLLPNSGGSCDRTVTPAGSQGCGDLFLPVDTSEMGAGMGPLGMDTGTHPMSYSQNRATIHLHGGKTPWISDGTPNQWITPAGEDTAYPKGVSVAYVPDMWFDKDGGVSAQQTAGSSNDPGDGAQTFYYTNQQSARLMFFHDHSDGITRLNVYAGEEAPYVIESAAEDAFKQAVDDLTSQPSDAGGIPTIPLVVQDKTFVPDQDQLAAQDPTWQPTRWGGKGNLWFPHVYMPNQNPGNDNGANPMGRWDYGPWFWPPFTGLKNGPVPNPLYDPSCESSSNSCENKENPGFPDVSMTMESFFDTMLINGSVYPYLDVQQKVYRFRILNGSNDRHLNLSLFYTKAARDKNGTPMWNGQTLTNGDAGEVPMIDATRAGATGDGCTPDQAATWPHDGRDGGVPACSAAGPDLVQIGNDGGFLPKPAVIHAQPLDYEYNRRNIIVLDVLHKGLYLAPAERADVLVDFSQVPVGSSLILYNDAPAASPALDPRNDYFTGDGDQTSSGGAPNTLPGYGPNTRTVMQINVTSTPEQPSKGLDLTGLTTALQQAYEADQPAPIIPQKAYNGLTLHDGFDASGNPIGNATTIAATNNNYVRLPDTQSTFTPVGGTAPVTVAMQPKAIVEEFDTTWGRMNATLGAELPNTNYNVQTTVPFGYFEPATEILDPHQVGSQLGTLNDGTQIWKITHNGVDNHPVHFHLFDVQVINRVGWDGAIYAPDDNELGWKDTVLMHPLEDTIVAMRPVLPELPFKLPDSIRPIDPTMPLGVPISTYDPLTGQAVTVPNSVQDFGWEYVWHCHMLSHEEMDFMRPVVVNAAPPVPQVGTGSSGATTTTFTWTEPTRTKPGVYPSSVPSGSATVHNYTVQRDTTPTFDSPNLTTLSATVPGTATSFTDSTAGVAAAAGYYYRVRAESVSGYSSWSRTWTLRPTGLTATFSLAGGRRGATVPTVTLSWNDNAAYGSLVLQRATNAAFTRATTIKLAAGATGYTDTSVQLSTSTVPVAYYYRVVATMGTTPLQSDPAGVITYVGAPAPPLAVPGVPSLALGSYVSGSWTLTVTPGTGARPDSYAVSFNGRTVTAAANGTAPVTVTVGPVAAGATYPVTATATNLAGTSAASTAVSVVGLPKSPTITFVAGAAGTGTGTVTVTPSSQPVTQYRVQWSTDPTFASGVGEQTVQANGTSSVQVPLTKLTTRTTYYARALSTNATGDSPWSSTRNRNIP